MLSELAEPYEHLHKPKFHAMQAIALNYGHAMAKQNVNFPANMYRKSDLLEDITPKKNQQPPATETVKEARNKTKADKRKGVEKRGTTDKKVASPPMVDKTCPPLTNNISKTTTAIEKSLDLEPCCPLYRFCMACPDAGFKHKKTDHGCKRGPHPGDGACVDASPAQITVFHNGLSKFIPLVKRMTSKKRGAGDGDKGGGRGNQKKGKAGA